MQDLPIFALQAGFDADEWRRALSIWCAEERRVAQGEALVSVGEAVRYLYVVAEGLLHVVVDDYWGNRSLLSVVEAGHIFGAAYAFGAVPAYPITALAVTPAVVWAIPVDAYQRSAETDPAVYLRASRAFMTALATRSVALLHSVEQVKQRTLRRKVLSYLSHLSRQAGSAHVTVPMSRQQMADYLAVDRTALSRELSALRADGLLDYHKNRFTLYFGQLS